MRRLSTTAAALTALATVGVGAGTAFAAGSSSTTTPSASVHRTKQGGTKKGPATLQGIQSKASLAVTARVDALNKEITKVQAAKNLGSGQAALLTRLHDDVTGLQALGQKIAGDTTRATAVADYRTVFTSYRGFVLPVVRLAATVDRIDTIAIPKVTALESKLAAHVTPTDSAQVTPLLNDITAQLAAAGTATKGLSAQLLSLTPGSWKANHSVLDQSRTAVKAAVGDLKKAAADAKQVRGDLKAARHSKAASSGTASSGA